MGNYVCVDPRAQHRGLTATTMDDTHAFLAARILHDKQAVTYRLLSREMGMHVAVSYTHLTLPTTPYV